MAYLAMGPLLLDMTAAVHFAGQQRDIAPLPAITDDDDNRSAAQHALFLVEKYLLSQSEVCLISAVRVLISAVQFSVNVSASRPHR